MRLNLKYEPELVAVVSRMTALEWERARQNGIGGSDAPVVVNASPFCTQYDLWLKKRNPIDEVSTSLKFDLGHAMESVLRRQFAKMTGYKVYIMDGMYRHPLYPFMLANIDGLVEYTYTTTTGEKKTVKAILECKTTDEDKLYEWAGDKIPEYYQWQARHYMSVFNLDKVFFICMYGFSPDKIILREISRNLDDENYLIEQEKKFWDCVVSGIEPYVDPMKQIKTALKNTDGLDLFGEPITLNDFEGDFQEYFKIDKFIKDQKNKFSKHLEPYINRKAEIELAILDSLQSNGSQSGTCTVNGVIYSAQIRQSSTRKTDYEALQFLAPELYDTVVKVTESSNIKLSKKKA